MVVVASRQEKELRAFVRQFALYGASVVWHEAGRGGMDGQPDCTVATPELSIGIELKVWLHRKSCFIAVMRPQQVRYHAVMAQRGIRTLVMFMTDSTDSVYAVPGYRVPHTVRAKIDDTADYIRAYSKREIEVVLNDIVAGVFWHGWSSGSLGI